MDREFAQFEGLESAIRESGEAERAGVFARTRVDARGLLRRSVSAATVYPIWVRRLKSIAAVLVIAAGVWSFMFVDQLGKLRHRATPVASVKLVSLTGPAVASSQPVRELDADADGDLDLADYRAFQLQFGVTR